MEYVLKDIRWYSTKKGFVPYIVNSDRTKIKILTNDQVYAILNEEVATIKTNNCTIRIKNSRKDNSVFAKYKIEEILHTLENAVGEKGVNVAPVDVFNVYFFSKIKTSDYIVYQWLNEKVVTTEELKKMTKEINSNKEKQCLTSVKEISNISKMF